MHQEQPTSGQVLDTTGSTHLSETILAALAAAGKDLHRLTLDDLAPLDEAHIRGRQATKELADRLELKGCEELLDLGCGLGGAARYLAAAYGCRVTGLDLNPNYIAAAWMLAERTGLSERVSFQQGDALQTPFADERFDVVWTQHAAMNIGDKPHLYREIYRLLKPGGKLAMFDVLAGDNGEVLFPVPWAQTPRESHLIRPAELTALFDQTGFKRLYWQDTSREGLAFFQKLLTRIQQKGYPPVGPHILFGSQFIRMAENVVRNLEDRRIVVVEAILEKSGIVDKSHQ